MEDLKTENSLNTVPVGKCIFCRTDVLPEEQAKDILPSAHEKCLLLNRRYNKGF